MPTQTKRVSSDMLNSSSQRINELENAGPTGALAFPQHFLWGTATAPTQIEGNISNEWTEVIARDGGTCKVACDSYHKHIEDISWMKRLGVNSYRFGIEWSRLQSHPYAELDVKELSRYRALLDALNSAKIVPMVVLHHFSNPPWAYKNGGWLNPSIVPAFVDYATKLATALRKQVSIWNTFNEPDTYGVFSYCLGEFPPFNNWRFTAMRTAIGNMAQAHLQTCQAIRKLGSAANPCEVGFSKNWTFFQPYRKYAFWDASIAYLCDRIFNQQVIQAFLGGRRSVASTFLGINYYGRVRFRNCTPLAPAGGTPKARLEQLGIVCDDMFERFPQGMELALKRAYRQTGLPLYITEHGAASVDEGFRIRDLKQNLVALHKALGDGVDVRGFYYWSLMDNFEWRFGYSKKFGLVAVDFSNANLTRSMKPTGTEYAQICTRNTIEP
jgi:beta-glucosidase